MIGGGPIGLSVLEFLKLKGATITVLDLNEVRLKFCKETMGVQHVVQAKDPATDLAKLQEITGGTLHQCL